MEVLRKICIKINNGNIMRLNGIFYSLGLIFLLTLYTLAQESEFRKLENKAFKVGEKLTFEVKYGFVTAGIAVMQIPKLKRISGRDVYHVTFGVNTVPSFDIFYKGLSSNYQYVLKLFGYGSGGMSWDITTVAYGMLS